MSYSDDYKDSPEYIKSEKEFSANLKRKKQLEKLIKEKYPEVWEYLMDYMQEAEWF